MKLKRTKRAPRWFSAPDEVEVEADSYAYKRFTKHGYEPASAKPKKRKEPKQDAPQEETKD